MALVHNGKSPPFFSRPIRPGEVKFYFVNWASLSASEQILSSVWNLPTGMTSVSEVTNVTCEDEGDNNKQLEKCNGVLISNTLDSGEHYVSNTITTTDGESETKGFFLRARDFTTV